MGLQNPNKQTNKKTWLIGSGGMQSAIISFFPYEIEEIQERKKSLSVRSKCRGESVLGLPMTSGPAKRMPLRSADFRRQIHWNLIFYFFHFLTCGSLRLSRRWASDVTWEDGRLIVDLRLLAQVEKDTKFRKFSLVRSWPYCGGSSGLKPLRRRAPYPLFKRSRLHCLHVYLTLWHIKLWWR